MNISVFTNKEPQHVSQAAALLIEAFPHAYAEDAMEEVHRCLEDERVACMAVIDGQLVGFVGAIPQYGMTGWELHPLVVSKAYRNHGIGSALLQALEAEVAVRGGLTIYLGSDDEFGQTSLSNTDLYDDLFTKLEHIQNVKNHPFEFYQKNGYQIVGVIPDANGLGKPDIWMAKRVVKHVEL